MDMTSLTITGSRLEALAARPTLDFPVLKDVRVHFLSLVACAKREPELLNLLSASEQETALGIKSFDRRIRFIASRAMLREVLTTFTGRTVGRNEWVFDVGLYGKPRVLFPDVPAPKFSISYTGDVMAIAVSQKYELGVDLETFPPVTDRDIPWQVLSSAERRAVQSLPQGEQFMEFLRLWTLKEAYTKYYGMGAALDFRGVQVDLDPLQATAVEARNPRLADPALQQQLLTIGDQVLVLALAAGRPRD